MSELLGVKITQALSNPRLDYCGFHRAELRIIKLGYWHSLTATCLHVITMSPFLSPFFSFFLPQVFTNVSEDWLEVSAYARWTM